MPWVSWSTSSTAPSRWTTRSETKAMSKLHCSFVFFVVVVDVVVVVVVIVAVVCLFCFHLPPEHLLWICPF